MIFIGEKRYKKQVDWKEKLEGEEDLATIGDSFVSIWCQHDDNLLISSETLPSSEPLVIYPSLKCGVIEN